MPVPKQTAPHSESVVRPEPHPRGFERRKLPKDREGITHAFKIGEVKGYITANVFEDGSLGEIFLKMDQQGSQVSGFCDAWAIAVSLMLQAGIPLDYIVHKYKGAKFEPSGMTNNQNIRIAQSPVDYVVRWLALKFLDAGEKE